MIEQQAKMSFFARVEQDFRTYIYMLIEFDKYVMETGKGYLLEDLYVSIALGIEIDFYLKYRNQYPYKNKTNFPTHIENMKLLEKTVFDNCLNLFENDLKKDGYYICAKLNTQIMKEMLDNKIEAIVTMQNY